MESFSKWILSDGTEFEIITIGESVGRNGTIVMAHFKARSHEMHLTAADSCSALIFLFLPYPHASNGGRENEPTSRLG